MEERALGLTPESLAAMHAAASLYYEEELSQQEVAKRLDVSRSTVSRLLQLARSAGNRPHRGAPAVARRGAGEQSGGGA